MNGSGTPIVRWDRIGLVAGLTLLMGGIAWSAWQQPEATAALRGERVARRTGCFACHGPEGATGTADPTAPAGRVPEWTAGAAAMYVRNEQEIREWIRYGAPRASATDRSDPERLIPMPAYDGFLSDRDLDDLVAYFVAVTGWSHDLDEMPDVAYEGRAVARRLGCFGCHGPSGMGGVANPGSFKGTIASWAGEDFADLVQNDDELRDWILDGRIRRLVSHPVARYFLDRQTIQMPAYRRSLSDTDLTRLLAYVHWLRNR